MILSIMAVASLFNTEVFASVNDDQVTSQKIKESDGTSGQDTNSGSGVKTGHIQDGAVTTSKIADGSVTDAKITGQISATKISSTGLNADTVDGLHSADLATAVHSHSQTHVTGLETALAEKSDVTHNHDVLYQQKYGKVAVVAQTGGDYTNPVTAMNNIAAWCGTPSTSNPCLLKVMPGIYDIGTNALVMNDYVDFEGSGENSTIIVGNVRVASHMEMRSLTVKANSPVSGANSAITIYYTAGTVISNVTVTGVWMTTGIQNAGSNALLRNVTFQGDGGTPCMTNSYGASPTIKSSLFVNCGLGIDNQSSACILENVIMDGSLCYEGVINNNAIVKMTNVKITASIIGVDSNFGSTTKINNSVIKGGTGSISSGNGTTYVSGSLLEGPVTGNTICAGVTDKNYVFYPNNCPAQ